MENGKIGVFDSGLGGLTSVKRIAEIMPNEDMIYFGDTGRVPYGTRSVETIKAYAKQDIEFLKTHELKAVVVACGTVSSVALEELCKNETLPIIGVVEPASKMAVELTKNRKVGVIGTMGTIKSASYSKVINKIDPSIEVFSVACPLFVPLVENGRFKRGDEVAKIVVREYLETFKAEGVDTLILGCTHFPLLADIIGDYLGEGVTLIDSGAAAARECYELLEKRELLSKKKENGDIDFYVSDDPQNFVSYGSAFVGKELLHEAEQIDITKF